VTSEQHYKYIVETREHVDAVARYLKKAQLDLHRRELFHDDSKFEEPEKSGFMAMAEELRLADTEYGSDEYRAILKKYKDSTIGHHYALNDHHPEHFGEERTGLRKMNLMQIIEMLCDWKPATMRMKDGNLVTSIEKNAERFGYGEEMTEILLNTAQALGMLE
jgi:hypothetical protein